MWARLGRIFISVFLLLSGAAFGLALMAKAAARGLATAFGDIILGMVGREPVAPPPLNTLEIMLIVAAVVVAAFYLVAAVWLLWNGRRGRWFATAALVLAAIPYGLYAATVPGSADPMVVPIAIGLAIVSLIAAATLVRGTPRVAQQAAPAGLR